MRIIRVIFIVLISLAATTISRAQPSCAALSPAIELGPVANTGSSPAVLASHILTVNSAWRAARLYFKSGEVLPDGSFLRITSSDDSAVQIIDSSEIGEWRYSSAYFNVAASHQLFLELVCAPHTSSNYIAIVEACRAAPRIVEPCNPCFTQPPNSDIKWAARIIDRDGSCSAALWSSAGCLVTARHCNADVGDIVQFNVPGSTVDGFFVHPAPHDQYIMSAIAQSPSIGDGDWAVIRTGRSAGLSAFQRQGQLRRIGRAFTVALSFPLHTVGYGAAIGIPAQATALRRTAQGSLSQPERGLRSRMMALYSLAIAVAVLQCDPQPNRSAPLR